MSYLLHPIIMCDLCHKELPSLFVHSPSGDGKTRTDAKAIREGSKEIGWSTVSAKSIGLKRRGKADLCPRCQTTAPASSEH